MKNKISIVRNNKIFMIIIFTAFRSFHDFSSPLLNYTKEKVNTSFFMSTFILQLHLLLSIFYIR